MKTFFYCAVTCLLAMSATFGQQKVALVIGNSAYGGDAELLNPKNDAEAAHRELLALGFKSELALDQDLQGMIGALERFMKAMEHGSIGLFYFAGHGMQVDGANYLIPLKANVTSLFQATKSSLDLKDVFDVFAANKSSANIVILDCCRNNPFIDQPQIRDISRVRGGLADVAPPPATIVAFSTAAGAVADDGKGSNSPYTLALVAELQKRPVSGLKLADVLNNTSRAVFEATGQDPLLKIPGSAPSIYLFGKPKEGGLVGSANHSNVSEDQAALDQAEMMRMLADMKSEQERLRKELANKPQESAAPIAQATPQNNMQNEAMKEMLALIQEQKKALQEEREAMQQEKARMPVTTVAISDTAPSRTFTPAPVETSLPAGSYVTRIGPRDQFNSKGTRLSKASDIMQQDRANYHKFNRRDSDDGYDPYLTSPEKRAAAYFSMTSSTASAVVNGNPIVKVILSGGTYQVSILSN